MYHSITFGDKNTWDDWHLMPTTRPVVSPPTYKTNFIDIPGANGALNASDLLTGHPTFGSRTGSFEFAVVNEFRPWEVAYTDIMAYLHGKVMKMVLEDDPDYYYEGSFAVSNWNSDKDFSKITIAYTIDPFKHLVEVPKEFLDISVLGELTVSVPGTMEYKCPDIYVKDTPDFGLNVCIGDSWHHLNNGRNSIIQKDFGPGEHTFTFYGEGTVTIDYRGGVF